MITSVRAMEMVDKLKSFSDELLNKKEEGRSDKAIQVSFETVSKELKDEIAMLDETKSCDICNGKGVRECNSCSGSGKITCVNCDGEGRV